MRKSNYDKMPATVVDGTLWKGWESIRKRLAEVCGNEGIASLGGGMLPRCPSRGVDA